MHLPVLYYALLVIGYNAATSTSATEKKVVLKSGDLVFPTEPTAQKTPSTLAGEKEDKAVDSDRVLEFRRRFEMASASVYGVATRLHTLLDPSGTKNYVISPLSVTIVVAQLLLGARGTSQRRMRELLSVHDAEASEQLLHRQLGDLLKYLQMPPEAPVDAEDDGYNVYILKAASAFFLQKDLTLHKNFWMSVRALYGSDFIAVDFRNNVTGAYLGVNQWGYDNTGGLITEILSRPLPPSTAVLIANTIYFKADWETPFSVLLTKTGAFNLNGTHKIDVKYMRGQFELNYAESSELDCKLIVLPYKQKDVNMYIILPNSPTVDVKDFSTTISPKNISNLIKSSSMYTVTVVMPKMKLKSTFSLRDPIMNYRPSMQPKITERFSADEDYYKLNRNNKTTASPQRTTTRRTRTTEQPTTHSTTPAVGLSNGSPPPNGNSNGRNGFDLSGASTDARFVVEDILHEVTLEVTETGTEAAAVSVGSVNYSNDIKVLKLDRPFLFFIRHELSSVNLFWGVVMDPTNGNYA